MENTKASRHTNNKKRESHHYETFTVGSYYQVNTKDKLGSGGFGKVYKGFDSSSGIFVAIKQIPLDKNKNKSLDEVKVCLIA